MIQRESGGVIDRIPPQSVDLEMCVLGGCMLEPDAAYSIAAEHLARSDFYLEGHGLLFGLMGELLARGIPPDMNAVLDELRSRELLEKVGGSGVVMGMLNSVPTAASVDFHARIVAEKARLRELIHNCATVIELAYRQELDPAVIIDRAQQLVAEVAGARRCGAQPGLVELAEQVHGEAVARWAEVDAAKEAGLAPPSVARGVATGYYDLDRMLGGVKPGQVCIIAARPSVGKSALGGCIAANIAQAGTPAAMVSYEMSPAELAWRQVAMQTYTPPIGSELPPGGVSPTEALAPELEPGKRELLSRALAEVVELPLTLERADGRRVRDLRSQARRLQREHGIGALVVDYLQLLDESGPGRNRTQEVGEISRGVHNLAVDLGLPVFLLAQLNRAVEARSVKRPQLSDLRDSGEIEQDADLVVFIHRPAQGEKRAEWTFDEAELIVAKNRNGPTGRAELLYLPELTRFFNAERSKR